MKIIAISGGTKNGSNDAMAKEALMGAKEAGADIEFIRLFDLELKPCTGCIACLNSLMMGATGDCVIKDDWRWLDEKLFEADGIIWVMPIFEKGASAMMHIVQDRLFGPSHDIGMNMVATEISKKTGKGGPDPRKFKKRVTSFISIGGSDWSTRVSCDMNLTAMVPMFKVIDDVVFQWSKSIILDDNAVAKCHQVGSNIAKAAVDAEHAEYKGDKGVCPNCHSRNFYLAEDGKAICEVCGIEGQMGFANGSFSFTFPEEQWQHAHNLVPGKMKHMDDIYHYETQLAQQKQTPEFKERVENTKFSSMLQNHSYITSNNQRPGR
jgi:multimeric flavodoxin WrbA